MGRSSIWPWVVAGAGLTAVLGGTALYGIAYDKGKPIGKIRLTEVDGKLIAENTAQRFLVMKAAAKRVGINLILASGFRTFEEQAKLYAAYLAGTGNYAAQPGWSNHQDGKAIDISVGGSFESPEYRWLAAHAKEYGFVNTGKNFAQPEPWHWGTV